MSKKKSTAKTYTVYRRYNVWASTTIGANSFDDAVERAKKMGLDEFIKVSGDACLVDFNEVDGFGVQEDFE